MLDVPSGISALTVSCAAHPDRGYVDRGEARANDEPAFSVFLESIALVPNNCQSKISSRAHNSNARRTATNTAHPACHRSPEPIVADVSIKLVYERLPARALVYGRGSFMMPPFDTILP